MSAEDKNTEKITVTEYVSDINKKNVDSNQMNEQANITFNKQNESMYSLNTMEKREDTNCNSNENNIYKGKENNTNNISQIEQPNPTINKIAIDNTDLDLLNLDEHGGKNKENNKNELSDNEVVISNSENNQNNEKDYQEANIEFKKDNTELNNNVIQVNLENLNYKSDNLIRINNLPNNEDISNEKKFKSVNLYNQNSNLLKEDKNNKIYSHNLNSNTINNMNENVDFQNNINQNDNLKTNLESQDKLNEFKFVENNELIKTSSQKDMLLSSDDNKKNTDKNIQTKPYNFQDSIERIEKDNRNLQNKFDERLDTIREKRKLYMNDIGDFNNLLTENNAYDDNHILSRDFFNPLTTESCVEKSNVISSFNNFKNNKNVSIFTNPKFINIINDLDKVKTQKNNENLNVIKNQISQKINKTEENKFTRHHRNDSNTNNIDYLTLNKPNNTLKQIYKIMSYDLQSNVNKNDKFSNIKLSVKEKFTNYQNQVINKNIQQSNVVSKSYLTPITKFKKNSHFNEAVNKFCKLEESNNIVINKLKITNDTRNFRNIKQCNNSRNISYNLYQNREGKRLINEESIKARKNLSEVKLHKNIVFDKVKLTSFHSMEKYVSKTSFTNPLIQIKAENECFLRKKNEKFPLYLSKEENNKNIKTSTNLIGKTSVKDNMFCNNLNRLTFNNNMASSYKINLQKEMDFKFDNQIKTSLDNLNLLSNVKPIEKTKVVFDDKLFDKNAQRIILCNMEIESNKKKFFELISK